MRIFEEDGVYNEAHAKELLQVQTLYNQKLQALNNELAKQKSNLAIKYLNAAKTKVDNQPAVQQKITGNVNSAGQATDAQGNVKAVESIDILHIIDINETYDPKKYEEPIRFTRSMPRYDQKKYEPKLLGTSTIQTGKKKYPGYNTKGYWKLQELEDEIDEIEQTIRSYEDEISTPDMNGEIEDFFGEIGFEAADVLNSGMSDSEKINILKGLNVKNPQEILDTYYSYYPGFDPSKQSYIKGINKEIAKLQIKLANKKKQLDVYESLTSNKQFIKINEGVFDASEMDPSEYQELKNYLDAQNSSYIENESDNTIEFNDADVDDEWLQRIPEKFDDEDDDTEEDDTEEDDTSESNEILDIDKKIDEDKVFYVKISNDGSTFYGKIYKLFDEGDWRTKVVKGKSDTFEKLNYDPNWDEFDVIAFLRENYDTAKLIDENEFNKIVESVHYIPTFDEFTIKK